MINARTELSKILEGKNIECVNIILGSEWDEYDPLREIILVKNYTIKQFETFAKEMDFEYDSGFGSQKIKGFVWLKDGTWLERGEYDGSEWWTHKIRPSIPLNLLS